MLGRKLIWATGVCALLLAAPLSATIVEYSDRATWELTTPGLSTIDFEEYDNGDSYQTYSSEAGLTINDIQFVGVYGYNTWYLFVVHESVEDHDFDSGAILKGPAYETANPYRYIQVNLPAGITSFGVDLMSVFSNSEAMSILINPPGGDSTSITTGIQPGSTFFGINSDADITQIQFKLTSGLVDDSLPALDNFSFGTTDISAVPEPGTYLMVGAGLLLIFRVGRKRYMRN